MKLSAWFAIGCLLLPPLSAFAEPTAYVGSEQWQKRRLFDPTPAELAQEAEGRVFIYDGLSDTAVDQALSEQFDRMQHMMFIRTKVTSPTGDVIDDDC